MANSDALIITHGDVDGMVCAAQLIRLEKSQYELRFSNAKYIKSVLDRMLKSSLHPRKIYISDIPANLEVSEILSSLSKNEVEIFWIDHHPWGDGVKESIESYCSEIVYNESLQTPAGVLMGRWLRDDDLYYEKVGNICYAYEKGNEWDRNWFRLLSSYIGKSSRGVLERLANNTDFTEDDLERIEQKKEDELRANEILKIKPKAMETKSNKSLAVYDTSEDQGIYLGHKVFEHHNVDYCLIRISKTKWQLACNPSKKYSMKHLMGEQNIEGYRFSLAGRENELLAIENQSARNLQIDLHGLLIDWLLKYL